MVAFTSNPSIQKAEAGGLQVQSQSGIERDPVSKDQGPRVYVSSRVFAWHEQGCGFEPRPGKEIGKDN